jgi:hypothetical protein
MDKSMDRQMEGQEDRNTDRGKEGRTDRHEGIYDIIKDLLTQKACLLLKNGTAHFLLFQ